MKRFISFLLACTTSLLCVPSVIAASPDSQPNNTTVVTAIPNEYDLLCNISEKSDEELSSQGYTVAEISTIRNYKEEYDEHLLQLKDLDEDVLQHLGYSDEQIDIFRDYTGTEEQIRSLAASLDFHLTADYVTWSASENRTNARLSYEFEWAGVPLVKTSDIVAVSWNDWTINGKSSYVTYTHIYGTEPDYSLAATYVQNDGPNSFGGGFKFAMTQEDNYFWAKSGYGIFTLYHNYERHDLSAYAEYGHSTFSVSPSFFIPGYGAINFSYGTEMEEQDWEDMACEN